MAKPATTVIIGGGCAGVLTARALVMAGADQVVLADPAPQPGPGVAYGAAQPWHLLNSPAGSMSARPDEPGHFLDWLSRSGVPAVATDFVSRGHYGRYLAEVLTETVELSRGRLAIRPARAVGLKPNAEGVDVAFDSGDPLTAQHAVLAVGNPPPRDLVDDELRDHPGYIGNPWAHEALTAVPRDLPVLLVGTGLTTVDVALSLAEFAPATPVLAVSRHGLLPQSHRPAGEGPSAGDDCELPVGTLPQLMRHIRRRAAATGDWRAVVDAMRPQLDTLWTQLDERVQQRFLEHCARYWEIHRHRMAPQVAARLDRLRRDNALSVRADAIRHVAADGRRLNVEFASGATGEFGAVVNCTGPSRMPAGASPLVAAALAEGLVRPGPHGLGLDVDKTGRLLDRDGDVHQRLWLIGSLRRGQFWETTAVPEIRSQAAELARSIGS